MYSEEHRLEKQREAQRKYRERHAEELKAAQEHILANPHEDLKAYWRERSRRNRAKNKELYRSMDARWYHNAKDKAFELLGNRCAKQHLDGDPFATDQDVLQIDHIDAIGDAERRRLNHKGIKLYREVIKDSKPFQLLCANHNQKKKVELGEHLKWRKKKSDSRKITSALVE